MEKHRLLELIGPFTDVVNFCIIKQVSKYLFATTKKGTIKEYKKLLYKKQFTHLKVLQLRYSGRDSIIQVKIDLIFIVVPLGEQKQNGGGTDI